MFLLINHLHFKYLLSILNGVAICHELFVQFEVALMLSYTAKPSLKPAIQIENCSAFRFLCQCDFSG